jgi:hypothetical protein
VVHDELVRELGDGHDKNYVEEELEPGSVTLVLGVLSGECAEARRAEPGLGGSRVTAEAQHRLGPYPSGAAPSFSGVQA